LNVTIVSPSNLLTLRGSEQFVLQTSRQFSRYPGVRIRVISFRRRYASEDISKLTRTDLRSRLETINSYLPPGTWSEFNWLSPIVPRRGWFFDRLNSRMEFVPLPTQLLRLLRNSDVIYFVTWRMEDLLAFLPIAFLAGRKGVIAGIHSRILLRRSEVPLISLWVRLGVLRGFHTIDSKSTEIFRNNLDARVSQIPNGVDCDLFSPGEKSRSDFVVLFAGSAQQAKGADLLPDIYAGLKDRISQGITMWICSSETGKLGREIAAWSKGKADVVFKGWVSRSELAVLLRQASVLLAPSRREVQSLSNLEAQASGTPVIATDLPSIRESVKDGETGLLVRKFEAEGFVDRLVKLHSMWLEGAPYQRMSEQARKNAVEGYSSSANAKKLLDLLASV
jgi:glycosyltransferase involved in cell wall biosynthesis